MFFSACVRVLCIFQLWSIPASVLICWNDKQCSRGWNNEGPSEGLISPAQVHPSSGIASCEGGVGVETRGRGIKVICHLILRSTWAFFINLFPSWGFGARCRWFEQRSDWFSSPFFFFFFQFLKGCVTEQFSQRENHEGFTVTDSSSSPYSLFRCQLCHAWVYFLLVMLWLSFMYS